MTEDVAPGVVLEQIKQIRRDVSKLEEQLRLDTDKLERVLENKYVSQDQFRPVQLIAYGFASMVLTSVMGALIMLVLRVAQ